MSFKEEALRDLASKIGGSAFFLSIFTETCKTDPNVLIQFAYAIMLDKPIYMLVQKGTTIPENIKRLARHLEEFTSPEDIQIAGLRLAQRAKEDLALS